ncbi:hypothetical protein FHS83_003005 [Rhizomicrobium palustre]|uniref:Uncharacterized protein n=1 Tax=Rhizomicrobium palustre TaxID=189966 RepID=A0A846N3K0_9PROT|nr:hypothetical protein [Rhizomicrobium palustre]NIK89687.1 hypothetical protein [Rhizomicrobium palustre]
MRYAEYHKEIARLDKEIAKKLFREERAANGSGPWYLHLFPDMRSSVVEKAARERLALAKKRALLERDMFGAATLICNADATAVFRRTVPSSSDAVETLRVAADAALEWKR